MDKALHKLRRRDSNSAQFLRAIIPIPKGDLAILQRFQPGVCNGDAKHVAAQILEDLLAAASRLRVHDPILLPD